MAVKKTDKIWHNGKFINWDDATLHVMAHVVHYGSAVSRGSAAIPSPRARPSSALRSTCSASSTRPRSTAWR